MEYSLILPCITRDRKDRTQVQKPQHLSVTGRQTTAPPGEGMIFLTEVCIFNNIMPFPGVGVI